MVSNNFLQVKDRIDTVNYEILRINSTRANDTGFYKCDVFFDPHVYRTATFLLTVLPETTSWSNERVTRSLSYNQTLFNDTLRHPRSKDAK